MILRVVNSIFEAVEMANINQCDYESNADLPSRSLVDLPYHSRPSVALHNHLKSFGPRGPRPLFFRPFLTMAYLPHAVAVAAGP